MKKASYIFVLIAFIVDTGLYVSNSMVTHGYEPHIHHLHYAAILTGHKTRRFFRMEKEL